MALTSRVGVVSMIAASLAVACTDSPVRPYVPAPSPGSASVRLTGHVTDRGGAPLSQAEVVITSDDGEVTEVGTDADGRFGVKLSRAALEYIGYVTKDGFEPVRFSLDYAALRADSLDVVFRLYAIVRVEAGRSIELSVSSGDDLCDYTISHVDRGPCRRVRIFSPRAGRLTISARVSAADEAAGHGVLVQRPDPPFGTSDPIEVGAEWEFPVEIIKIGAGETTRFTLQTTFAP
jgi:hypothetical protein